MLDDDEFTESVTLDEIAKAVGRHKRSVSRRANNEGWTYTEKSGAGKPLRLYDPKHLPEAIRLNLMFKKGRDMAEAEGGPLIDGELQQYLYIPGFEEGYSDGWCSLIPGSPISERITSDGYFLGFGCGRRAGIAQWQGEEAYKTGVLFCPYAKNGDIQMHLRGWWLHGYREAMDEAMEDAA